MSDTDRVAVHLEVHGTVQGVGFRPYVYRMASELGLDGAVWNAGGRVVIEAAGAPPAVSALTERLPIDVPPHAKVTALRVVRLDPRNGAPRAGVGFRVIDSVSLGGSGRAFPPDLPTCADCLRELFDRSDRRYRYPFINCTNCGPRATIIDDLPYDRAQTTMALFGLCAACATEYADPLDRRFHAEPIACPACGPRLAWHGEGKLPTEFGEAALPVAIDMIDAGRIVALKGIGGYQLVCDATAPPAVDRLRRRKHRLMKPLAVMVGDLGHAHAIADLHASEAHAMQSVARPIVLATASVRSPLAPGVHPDNHRVGVFLPYSPLHHLLLEALDRPLVMTSGNRSDEPIATDDLDAYERLGSIADGFLIHDRGIRAQFDDSVVSIRDGRISVVRRARGYAPAALPIPIPAGRPVLAVGAQLKHTFALADSGGVILSPHLGDLSDHRTELAFRESLAHLSRLVGIAPEIVAHDLHEGYLSTQYAHSWPDIQRIGVQHHHAHVASCAAEHGLTQPFIGVAYDGLGLGDDGTLWGGEVLVADLIGYRRVGRFAIAAMAGGEAAVRRPARMALGYLFGAEGLAGPSVDLDLAEAFLGRLPPREVEVVRRMVARGVNTPSVSSAVRRGVEPARAA